MGRPTLLNGEPREEAAEIAAEMRADAGIPPIEGAGF
jgi:hypothetical protein